MPISKVATWLLLWDFLVTAIVTWLLLHFRWSARMRDLAERLTRFRSLQTCALLDSVHYYRLRDHLSLERI